MQALCKAFLLFLTASTDRELVPHLASETGWGYTHILGKLRKLGVGKMSRSTVNNLREAGLDPSPERSKGNWHTFIREHLTTLWACDLSARTLPISTPNARTREWLAIVGRLR